jgi:alcohol dehydrogenase
LSERPAGDSPASFDLAARTRVVFGRGVLARLGDLARELGLGRVLLVADPGLAPSGHPGRARRMLEEAGIEAVPFADFEHDPDSRMVERGAAAAREAQVDGMVAVGGGSSLDCAKGLNFLLTNGGRMADYRGYGKAKAPLLPMIAVPTTAGTGSEAQSYALISDADTHEKMACGDPSAAFRLALLDPELTVSLPRAVTASAGYDALSHAVEAYATTRRNALSSTFAREAFRLIDGAFERVLAAPDDLPARGDMMIGAHLGGLAIEASMLGATHACANPLSARYGTTHGVAIALCSRTWCAGTPPPRGRSTPSCCRRRDARRARRRPPPWPTAWRSWRASPGCRGACARRGWTTPTCPRSARRRRSSGRDTSTHGRSTRGARWSCTGGRFEGEP